MRVNFILSPLPFLGDPKRNAPLGVMLLAAVSEKAGMDTAITDLRDKDMGTCLDAIAPADIYGFSATTPEYPTCRDLAKKLKDKYPKAVFVLGGVHATVCTESIDPVFDVIASGEGEGILLEIFKDIAARGPKKVYRANSLEDIARIPWPARHLLPRDSFVSYSLVEKGKPATPLMTSRGCAFDCSFCASRVMWSQKCRYRTVDDVLMEIHDLRETYGVEQLRFQDDDLALNRRWLLTFCERMKPLKMVWRANARMDNSNKEILAAMQDAGCDEVCYGIESPEQEVLGKCNKKARIESAYDALATARSLGLKTRIFLIIGLPGQDTHVASNMIDFIKETRPSAVDLSTFVPFPGSDIYRNPGKYNIRLRPDIDFDDYVMTRGLYGDEKNKDFVFEHDILSNEQLKALRAEILDFIQNYKLVQNK